MKKFLFVPLFFLLLAPSLFAATPSTVSPAVTFINVKGKVTVGKKGRMRKAVKDHKAVAGETVRVFPGGTTTLRLFDGSEMDLMGGSQLKLAVLKQPKPEEKQIRFSLNFGSLLARVKKLLTSNSSFEVEAGGVVCGVRGTQFSVAYNSSQQKVDLKVLEGSVFARSGGQSKLVGAGQQIEFLNGKIKVPKVPPTNPSSSNNKKGNKDNKGGGSSVLYPPNGKFIDPTGFPQNPDPSGSLGLGDLNNQFVNGVGVNGNNNVTNPAAGAGARLNILMHLGSQETVP